MKHTKERLYELLPAIYRQRDIEVDKPLEALLDVIEEQVKILRKDIDRLYNNWFIETCDPWVIPYIGDLVGATILHTGNNNTINLRAFVANTIGYRRRKGTLSMLEQLARDVTGWSARAVEFFKLLGTTQYLNHLRLSNLRTPDLREIEALELLNTPFDTIAHTVDVHNISEERGYYNIPNIGIYLWRLQAYPVKNAPAFKRNQNMYTFSQLGYDIELFNHPITEISPHHIAEEINVPIPIRRRALSSRLRDYYNGEENKSILIKVDGLVRDFDDIVVYDLSEYRNPPPNKVAIDPVLGLIIFPVGEEPKNVHVSYYYGFSSELGGGFYERPASETITDNIYYISKDGSEISKLYSCVKDAVEQWYKDIDKQNIEDGKNKVIFEIIDSEFYDEDITLELPPNFIVELRSKQKQRPVLRGKISVVFNELGKDDIQSHLILDGFLIVKSITIDKGDLGTFTLKHCTLVPSENPSIMVTGNINCKINLYRTISGGINIEETQECQKKPEITIVSKDCIIDGKGSIAIKCFDFTTENCTIFGEVEADMISLASNTIFTEKVTVKRRQVGCVRFCNVPYGSKVPRRYQCQPEFQASTGVNTDPKVYLQFNSNKYGDPDYAQLSKNTSPEIFTGADNGAEMGVFNHLHQAHRITNLKSCLDEYLRFGLEAGIILES